MKKGTILSSFILACLAVFWTFVPSGCANKIPPAGGARDSIPPRLLKADPPDSTLNFNRTHITFNFDEYIDLKDLSKNVIFTPSFDKQPVLKVKARTVMVDFQEPLEPNTTYVLNFGNAIVDMNEGNILKDFKYTFSTGAHLDSLEISGKVVLAQTGGIDSTLVAVLHRKLDDSAVVRDRPMYITRLDRNGGFHFRNLPSDTFALYVLEDIGARRYTAKTQLFGFAPQPVIPGKTDSVLIYAYREEEKKTSVAGPAAQRIPANDRRLRYNQITNGTQDLLKDYVLSFPVPLREFDSTKTQLSTDSSFNATVYSVHLDSTRSILSFHSDWKDDTRYNLILQKDFASDTAGRQLLKTDTLFFTTKKAADYGKLTVRLTNVDLTRHPVLQFVQNNQVVLSVPVSSGTFSQQLFLPGEYGLRILYDENENGKWDPGSFFKGRKQPEIVHVIDRTISVKPDWDNEFEIGL